MAELNLGFDRLRNTAEDTTLIRSQRETLEQYYQDVFFPV